MPKLKYTSPGVGFLDTRYLKLDQTIPQTLTASPVLNWMTNGSVPFIGTGGYLSQDNSHLYFNSTTYDLYAYTISTSGLTVTGWTEGWVLHAGAGGAMVGENEFNYVTATNTLNVANIVSTGEINGVTLSTANLDFNTNVITSTTGLVHFNDDNLYTGGYMQANYFASDVAIGTAPFQCTSTTLNTNLNADLLDGYHWTDLATYYLKLDQTSPQTLTASPIINNLTAGRVPYASATKTLTDNVGLSYSTTTGLHVENGAVISKEANLPERGSNLNTNTNDRTFAADTGNWTGTNWSIYSGHANHTAYQGYYTLSTPSFAMATQYIIQVTINTTTTGVVFAKVGSATCLGYAGEKLGIKTVYFHVDSDSLTGVGTLSFFTNATWVGYIDNVYVYPITPATGQVAVQGYSLLPEYDINIINRYDINESIFFGASSGQIEVFGGGNLGIGNNALRSIYSGAANLAIGVDSLKALTSGNYNTAYGTGAGQNLISGDYNTAIGSGALNVVSSGSRNTAFGYGAGAGCYGDGSLFLGYYSGTSETGSNKLYISNSDTTSPLIYGEFDGAGGVGIRFNSPSSTSVVNVIKLYLSQTANAWEIRNSSNTLLANFEADGELCIPQDSKAIKLGGGLDATILYDGTNLLINPKLVGTGYLNIQGQTLLDDKLMFTQTDGNEYVDSLADGYLDLAATTGIRLTSPLTRVTGDLYVGNNADADPAIVFDGDTSDGQLTYFEDTGRFGLSEPLTLDTGDLLVTPVAGTFEFYNDRMHVTNVGIQRVIDRTSDVIVATTTVANTTDETTIFTASIPASSLKAGNVVQVHTSGIISNNSASDDITINLKFGGSTLVIFNPAIGNITAADWHFEGEFTARTIGGSGTYAFHGHLVIDDHTTTINSTGSVDTTASNDFTVTVQWDNAKTDNTISIYQGFVTYKN